LKGDRRDINILIFLIVRPNQHFFLFHFDVWRIVNKRLSWFILSLRRIIYWGPCHNDVYEYENEVYRAARVKKTRAKLRWFSNRSGYLGGDKAEGSPLRLAVVWEPHSNGGRERKKKGWMTGGTVRECLGSQRVRMRGIRK